MSDKGPLATALYNKWEAIQTGNENPAKCFVGFDGFTDEIIHPVKQRLNAREFDPFSTIDSFGKRIIDAAGKSCNIELVVQKTKLGGNAPIMTNAMVHGSHDITFCGAIGQPGKIEPIFQEMAAGCKRVIPLGPSAHSDALEFEDGKVILGKLDALKSVNYHTILAHVTREELTHMLDNCDLFVCANWTMLPMMNELWKHLLEDIVPQFRMKRHRYLFVDLADPAKRTDEDLNLALERLQQLNEAFQVVLGLNESEATRIHQVLISRRDGSPTRLEDLAQAIHQESGLHMIVVHATWMAMSASDEGIHFIEGPYTNTPKLTTGAGDNFNAGFCTALLYGLPPADCLLTGVSTSGFYVRRGQSPTIPELAAFLHQWEEVSDPQLLE